MKLSEMLLQVPEAHPRGEVDGLADYLLSCPVLMKELLSWTMCAGGRPPLTITLGAWGWLLDALLNYGLPDDLEELVRGKDA